MSETFSLNPIGEDRGAILGDGGHSYLYRYDLWRAWGSGIQVAFIGLNPSTANAYIDDPTIRRCRNFAKAWGYDGFHMLNLFAWRATDPNDLKNAARFGKNVRGPENAEHIARVVVDCGKVICAWGSDGALANADEWLKVEVLPRVDLWHLGLCKNGQPRHPLYLRKDAKPELWRKAEF